MRNKAILAGALPWLEELPATVSALERQWSFRLGRPYEGGTESFVAEAHLEAGDTAVLKLLMPRDEDAVRNEIRVLQLAGGEGCPRLFRHDAGRGAMLMERLGPSLFELDLPISRRHEILTSAARRIWRPAPDSSLPTGAGKGRWLIDYITKTWEDLDHPCSEQAVEHGVSCAQRRIEAHDDERSVLVHGDVHQWNALRAVDGFKLVDPDGLLAEAECDMGILMREDPIELLEDDPWERAHLLAALTGPDPTAIWEWGVVERVSTGLLCTAIDLQPAGREMLAVADRLATLPA